MDRPGPCANATVTAGRGALDREPIGVLIATIILGWALFQSDLGSAQAELAKVTSRIERLETTSGETKDRLTRMEVTLQNVSVQIERVARMLERKAPLRFEPPG